MPITGTIFSGLYRRDNRARLRGPFLNVGQMMPLTWRRSRGALWLVGLAE